MKNCSLLKWQTAVYSNALGLYSDPVLLMEYQLTSTISYWI